MSSIIKVNTYQDANGNALFSSDGSGNVTLSAGAMKNTPNFMVLNDSSVTINANTNTALTFDTEIYDSNNAVSSGLFTVPSGEAGKYYFTANCGMVTGSDINEVLISLAVNGQTSLASNSGDAVCVQNFHKGSTTSNIFSISAIFNLSVGDTVGVRVFHNFTSSRVTATDGRCTFSGYKLIGA